MKNEIIEEVREARAALAAEHGYDRQRIYEWARATTAAHKQAQRTPSPNKALEATGGAANPSVPQERRVRPSGASA
jgi:hypothetical protein